MAARKKAIFTAESHCGRRARLLACRDMTPTHSQRWRAIPVSFRPQVGYVTHAAHRLRLTVQGQRKPTETMFAASGLRKPWERKRPWERDNDDAERADG